MIVAVSKVYSLTVLSIILAAFTPAVLQAGAPQYAMCGPGMYQAEVMRVIDGDTLEVRINLGLGVYKSDVVRLGSIDTPETFRAKTEAERKRGKLAAAFVRKWLKRSSNRVELITDPTKPSKIRGRYGRLIADVWAEGEQLATALEKAGHSK